MNLPRAISDYVRALLQIEQADAQNWKKTGDVDHPHSLVLRGGLKIGDDANADVTLGLTINQGANSDQILAFKASSIAHGYTTGAETDTYATFGKSNGAEGGLTIQSLNEDAGTIVVTQLKSIGGTADATKSTAGRALVEIYVSEHNGANTLADITADGNVFGIRARRGGADVSVEITDEDGDKWLSGGITHLGRRVSTFQTFGSNDATPSVALGTNFVTANSGPTTVTALDDGVNGQEVFVKIGDANTTIDFTGTTLKGNGGADWSPANGDFMRCKHDGTNWLCSVHDAT